nr:MAG TPA: hypothetical protein [Caudoviricetes sp.]
MNGRQYDLLDAITMVSFIVGLLNYGENVDQTTINDTVQSAVQDIHKHLAKQDEKITKILQLLEGEK